jgi:hypothetical protein
VIFRKWDLNFGTWISHRGFTMAFGHGHPLVTYVIAFHHIYINLAKIGSYKTVGVPIFVKL